MLCHEQRLIVYVRVCVCSRVSVMALSIVSACCRASVVYLCLLACILQVSSQGEVFHQAPQAHDVFLRPKRANMFLLEELLQGNLERECYEEQCNFEEAREYFEDNKKTIAFWTVYVAISTGTDGDQCKPNPCLHDGNCTDMLGGFQCTCAVPHFGRTCELGAVKRDGGVRAAAQPERIPPKIVECPTEGPAACQQLCTASHFAFTCSCMPGFKLQGDKRSCLPEVEFPCGRRPDQFNTSVSMCHGGNCPWQVSLLNSSGVELCGGVVLGKHSVLTTAHCVLPDSGSDLQPSNLYVAAGNLRKRTPVRALYIHERFRKHHHDNDLALLEMASPLPFGPNLIQLCLPTKDFSENVLMHSGKMGVFKQTGGTEYQDLVYMSLDECRSNLNVSHPLSNKMFCMKKENGATANQNHSQETTNLHLKNRNELHRMGYNRPQQPHGPLRNQNGAPRPLRQHLGNHRGVHRMLDRDIENGDQNQTQFGVQRIPNGAENQNGSIQDHLEDSGSGCGSLLPGAPVATVEQGTAFLTGLMISSSSGCDNEGGLVFTKLSRYLTWIKPRLEASEDRMTPQVRTYPEIR
ncbi:venom prothrombin activator notecarin-D2-like isoform X1 [Channa argus]|uniref:venom prothrombin activator notecarin-D2-like isoform X1 n=2 Tax=Channa argus TaxID=215402 RepID=UPI003520E1B2